MGSDTPHTRKARALNRCFSVLKWLSAHVDFLYLLRVPLFTWLFVALVGMLASWNPARPMMKNLFYVESRDAFWILFSAVNACFAALACSRAICFGAPSRFRNGKTGPPVEHFLTGCATAAPLLLVLLQVPANPAAMLLMIAAAVAVNALLLLVAGWLADFRIRVARDYPGYVEPTGDGKFLLRREHVMNAVFATFYLLFAIGVAVKREAALPNSVSHVSPPTLALLFAIAAFACLFLSALAFFLDRYRLPLSAAFLLFSLIAACTERGDHFFHVFKARNNRPTSADVLQKPGKIILVAASGGGIQASAWTAQVLTGLASEAGFSQAVRAISAVSGGSLGSLCFLRTFPASSRGPSWTPNQALKASMLPSLEAIAYGTLRYELPRFFFFESDSEQDRGWALEQAITKRLDLDGVTLSDWAPHAGQSMPAVIFNATAMESGAPVVFSTTRMPPSAQVTDFAEQADVAVSTAVRMSATFPYVSPAARPGDRTPVSPHIGDGGYYDNSGLENLIDWFEPDSGKLAKNVKVLFVLINAFPPDKRIKLKPQSWIYDLWSPLGALMAVRSMGQSIHGGGNVARLEKSGRVNVVRFLYNPDEAACSEPSLSWDMNQEEINCIAEVWRKQTAQVKTVRDFLDLK